MHYLIEESFWKLLETLGADKALLVVKLSITVDDFLSWSKATFTPLTGCADQGIRKAVTGGEKKKKNVCISPLGVQAETSVYHFSHSSYLKLDVYVINCGERNGNI